MTYANGSAGTPRYSVSFPPPLLDRLRVWAEEARRLGLATEFLAALRQVNKRLQSDPNDWGDELREFPMIGAIEMRGMIPKWLLVWYGFHAAARQVIVRDLLPAPGSPLSPPTSPT